MVKDKEPNQGHWVGQIANPCDYLGFVYLIEDETSGKKYIGRKQFWLAKPKTVGCKSKVTDKSSPKWKPKCWRESDWRTYSGSSSNLKKHMLEFPDHVYTHTILKQCRTKSQLHYAEVEALVFNGVLWLQDKEGEYVFFNRQVPATRFRVPNYKELK